jgi:hypothetical protein
MAKDAGEWAYRRLKDRRPALIIDTYLHTVALEAGIRMRLRRDSSLFEEIIWILRTSIAKVLP